MHKDEIHEEFYQVFQELKKQNIIFAAQVEDSIII